MLLLTLAAEVVRYCPDGESTARPFTAAQRHGARSARDLDLRPEGRCTVDVGHVDDTE